MISKSLLMQVEAPVRATYEAARLEELRSMPLVAGLAVVGLLAILVYSRLIYRRESSSIPRPTAWFLSTLRIIALAGVVILALDVIKREAREVTDPSRVVILADASQSMGLPAQMASSEATESRADEMRRMLNATPLLAELRQRHTVEILRFAEQAEPVASLPRVGMEPMESQGKGPSPTDASDWSLKLEPTGGETRLADALQTVLQRYADQPLAGVIVVSDGGQNAGGDPAAAAKAAKDREIAIHTIGFGPLELPPNIVVRALVAPKRAYPGDRMTIAAEIEAHAVDSLKARVELLRQPIGAEEAAWEMVAEQEAELERSGTERVEFTTTPAESGDYTYELRVTPLEGEANLDDNVRRAEVSIVDRKLRVLLFAGGPSREYQFLRNQLQRDKNVTLDVLLQSAGTGAAQDADTVLTEFPKTREQIFEYDVLVAFDPNWSPLEPATLELLEAWVAEQAGGMIVAPGPISTRRWVQNATHEVVRSLYPVIFDANEVELASSAEANNEPVSLELTQEAATAEFLKLSDDPDESSALWAEFPGVYGIQAGVAGTKPGTTVYARLSSASSAAEQTDSVFFAEQFYGSGRVFYLGSAELWRLRMLDPALFERLYTKLVQHVAQGRLQRGSSRGTLLVERDQYQLGETVVLRARLTDAQLKPLAGESVEAQILQPDETVLSVRLRAEPGKLGSFIGEFRVAQPGQHLVNLAIPDSSDELVERIRVELPVLERQPLVQNRALLQQIAAESGGYYYASLDTVLNGSAEVPALSTALPDRSETRVVYSNPDEQFAARLRLGLLGLICGALFTEWSIRRWNRLA
ncbi:MAG: vWA domain-containing protein [Pirellulales bacterium]